MAHNRIASLLGITAPAGRAILEIEGNTYEYHPAGTDTYEGIYRRSHAGFGSSNACFSFTGQPNGGDATQLGIYLAGGSHRSDPRRITGPVARVALTRAQQTVKVLQPDYQGR